MSSSLKYATRSARNVFANNFSASASVDDISSTGTSGSTAPSRINCANVRPASESSPTTMRDGCWLSCSAWPSRRNSGEKKIVAPGCRSRMSSVNPTGTVDLITIAASGFTASAPAITLSTERVSNRFVFGS